MSAKRVRALLDEARAADVRWEEGRAVAGLVYLAGDDVAAVARDAYWRFFSTNANAPRGFPSVARFERDLTGFAASLLHAPGAVGCVTSGGTESIFLAARTARDRMLAAGPPRSRLEIVLPCTAHPAFDKAAHHLGLAVVRTPLREDLTPDLGAYAAAVSDATVLLGASAPDNPFGMVDPIPEMAEVAARAHRPLHVDASLGGYFLPFAERLGSKTALFDFRVRGVTSLSADLHKFGFGPKGTSILLFRDSEAARLWRLELQPEGWPPETYDASHFTGTRPGAAVAAAWAVMNYLGEDGYERLVEQTLRVTRRALERIKRIPGLGIRGRPDMSVFAVGSDHVDMAAVAGALQDRGWLVTRHRRPPSIHHMLSAGHGAVIEEYMDDLERIVSRLGEQRA